MICSSNCWSGSSGEEGEEEEVRSQEVEEEEEKFCWLMLYIFLTYNSSIQNN